MEDGIVNAVEKAPGARDTRTSDNYCFIYTFITVLIHVWLNNIATEFLKTCNEFLHFMVPGCQEFNDFLV